MRLRRKDEERHRKGFEAAVRVARRTKHLIPRLRAGEIAAGHHEDIDRVAAEGLIAAGVSAVFNATQSLTGKYPAQGALLLLQSLIHI